MPIDIPALRRMLEEATPEPWECDVDGQHTRDGNALEYFATDPDGLRVFDTLNAHRDELTIEPDEDGVTYSDKRQRANARLICALRNSAADLLDELERLRAELANERERCARICVVEAAGYDRIEKMCPPGVGSAERAERAAAGTAAEALRDAARRIREGTP